MSAKKLIKLSLTNVNFRLVHFKLTPTSTQTLLLTLNTHGQKIMNVLNSNILPKRSATKLLVTL